MGTQADLSPSSLLNFQSTYSGEFDFHSKKHQESLKKYAKNILMCSAVGLKLINITDLIILCFLLKLWT